MKKAIKTLVWIIWVLLGVCAFLPNFVDLGPVGAVLAEYKSYILAGFVVWTALIVIGIVVSCYCKEVKDDDCPFVVKKDYKVKERKERGKIYSELENAEFRLKGETNPGDNGDEPLTRIRLLREGLVIVPPTKKELKRKAKEEKMLAKQAANEAKAIADEEAAERKETEKENARIAKEEAKIIKKEAKAAAKAKVAEEAKVVVAPVEEPVVEEKVVATKTKYKPAVALWIFKILFLVVFAVGFFFTYGMDLTSVTTMLLLPISRALALVESRELIWLIYFGAVALIFVVSFIVYLAKRKTVLSSLSFLLVAVMAFYGYCIFGSVESIQEFVAAVMSLNIYAIMYVVGYVGLTLMFVICMFHYAFRKPIVVEEKVEETPVVEEKTEVVEEVKEDEEAKLAAENAKKAEEEARIAAEEAKKAAEEARLVAEKAKAEEEARIAAEKAKAEEEARIAAEKAKAEEEARIAAEKAKAEEEAKTAAKPKALIPLKKVVQTNVTLWDKYNVPVSNGWVSYINAERKKPYFADMMAFVKNAYETNVVYPKKEDIFRCFEYTDIENTKVVILGKLPFYRKDQADGLAYSTKVGVAPNQTTKIIVQEAVNDVNIAANGNHSLVKWARQGVLLLNSVMTAPADKPASHSDCGWVEFTDGIIKALNEDSKPKVFILWGEYAREKVSLITNPNHLILEAPNPSPLSAANGFYGSKPYSQANDFLTKNGYTPIKWDL